MTYRLLPLLPALLAAPPTRAADPPAVSAERIKADVAFLASDRLEGRGPGTRGEELTTEFIAAAFKKAGLKPAGADGTYLQPVPLLRVTTSPKSALRAAKGKDALDLAAGDDFSGTSQTQTAQEEFDAEAVFVGHGITAPEFGWDDYKGVDVKGKVVVLFTNEPPSDDPAFFGGKALTYYGRWTFKFEEAARRGAKACLIVHTDETAGYPYSVVRPLDGAQLTRDPGAPALAFAGWLSRKAGEKLLGLSGRTVDDALKAADTKGFKAVSLGFNVTGKIETTVEKVVSNNVVGVVEGSDPALKAEAVVFTAHWDHLGVGRAVAGDTVYNGAADNATGTALLMELARAWAALDPKPKRSAVFLAVTAEEKGLLGSKYYARNPAVPLGKTAVNLNFDMILPLGVPESVVVTGAERTTAWPAVRAAARRHGLEVEPDPRAHLGVFYRSDHFSLARAGVPAFSVGPGGKVKGKAADFVKNAYREFNEKAYHSPQDEVRPDWDYSGFPVLGGFALDVARAVADADRLPTWNPGDEFRPAREKSGVKAADEPPAWPPALTGAKDGTVTLKTDRFLDVPEAVAAATAKDGAAPFTVAKAAPAVDLAYHRDLGPDAVKRRLWSSWGDICLASDGRVYCAVGDHGDDAGGNARCFLYRWDPARKALERVVDLGAVVPPAQGQPAWSKVHAKIDEAPDGAILFSGTLNDGNRAGLPAYRWTDRLPGGQLYRFDPKTGKTSVVADLPAKRCTATSLLDRERQLWWCNLEAGGGNALWCLDLRTGKPVFQADDGTVGFNRNFALARDGSVVFNGKEGVLWRYDPAKKAAAATQSAFKDSPGMRSSTRESKDGWVYGTAHGSGQLFRYSPSRDKLEMLGPAWLAGDYVTVVELSPDERYLYYLPGAHGGAIKTGTPVVQYEVATGRRKVLAFLAAAFEEEYDYVPAGTYGMKVSADGGTLYVNFNGHAGGRTRPAHMKPNGFGLCAFAAVHVPASER
jgi:Zn-dependent M28 family amino/carboxypeptidase